MRDFLTIIIGKMIQKVAQIKGGGSALPGLFVEKVNQSLIARLLDKLPHGVVIISGTNGKTTTTKMVTELLEAQGLTVFTNKTGSNFVRGIAAAILEQTSWWGKFEFGIAVLELDEAHAIKFLEVKKPRYSLLLNVMRDQLDRFGEVDYTASLLQKIGEATEKNVILNRNDRYLGEPKFSSNFKAKVKTFGASAKLLDKLPSDAISEVNQDSDMLPPADDVSLEQSSDNLATIAFSGNRFELEFIISGTYNLLNSVAAIALVRAIFAEEKLDLDQTKLLQTIQNIKPAFGRGEIVDVAGVPIELVLVKNPSGFQLSLSNFKPDEQSAMIAVNDNYADGRDMSWLWDVDFLIFKKSGVGQISGVRAYDMALRLFHDDVKFDESDIETDLKLALDNFLHKNQQPKRIFCTYTAMLKLREELAKLTDVEKVL